MQYGVDTTQSLFGKVFGREVALDNFDRAIRFDFSYGSWANEALKLKSTAG